MRTGAAGARQAVRSATERLERAGVPEPAASAEVLLSELLGIGRAEIALHDEPLRAGHGDLDVAEGDLAGAVLEFAALHVLPEGDGETGGEPGGSGSGSERG